MHIGLRTILATAGIGLALAPAAFADTATETLVLSRDACGGKDDAGNAVAGADNPHLGWNISGATNCGNLAAGLDTVVGASPEDYPSEGVDTFTLDGTRQIAVDVSVEAFYPLKGGIGNEDISIDLTGKKTTSNKVVELGSATQEKAAQDELLGGNYTAHFTLNVPAGAAGDYKSLNLSLAVGGAQFGGFVMTDGNSFVQLPIPGDVDASPPDAG